MRLTRGSDYGLRGMIYLASQPADKVSLIHEIAQSQEIPDNYLAKIFQDLAKNGLIRSHRGRKGGFALARPADEITLRQAIEAIQGPLALNDCLDPRQRCELAGKCCLHQALREAQNKLFQVLDGITLRDLVQAADVHQKLE